MADSGLEAFFPTLPFLDQMGLTALLSMLVIAVVSLQTNKNQEDEKGIALEEGIFTTSSTFNIGAFALMIVLAGLYAFFW